MLKTINSVLCNHCLCFLYLFWSLNFSPVPSCFASIGQLKVRPQVTHALLGCSTAFSHSDITISSSYKAIFYSIWTLKPLYGASPIHTSTVFYASAFYPTFTKNGKQLMLVCCLKIFAMKARAPRDWTTDDLLYSRATATQFCSLFSSELSVLSLIR